MSHRHTKLFGSTSSRTLGCPAHYQRGLTVPEPPTSDAALEGTMLHNFCEEILLTGDTPESFPKWSEIDFDQQNIVSTYVGLVREVAEQGGNLYVEKRTVSEHLHPEWFGTADAVVVNTPRLTIADLKCGRVPVGVYEYGTDNRPVPQLGSYAISVLENLKPSVAARISEVELIIVQPREGGIKRAVFTRQQLDELKERLLSAAKLAESKNPPAAIGPWCHFCKVKPLCPTQREMVYEQAKLDFALDGNEAEDLQPVDLHQVLAVADLAMEWGQSVKNHAERLLNEGDPLDGNWQLVPKRGKRVWIDEAKALALLTSAWSFRRDDLVTVVMKTPAQVEALAKRDGRVIDLSDLAHSVGTGLKISRVLEGEVTEDDADQWD